MNIQVQANKDILYQGGQSISSGLAGFHEAHEDLLWIQIIAHCPQANGHLLVTTSVSGLIGLLTLLAISIDLECPMLGTDQTTRSTPGCLKVVVHNHCRMVGRRFPSAANFETILTD